MLIKGALGRLISGMLQRKYSLFWHTLTHWGRVTQIYVGNITIIASDNGLSPGRRQAIIWTNVGILLNGPLGTNFSEMLIGIQTFSSKEMHLKMSSVKLRPSCLGLNVLTHSNKFQNLWFENRFIKSCWVSKITMHYMSFVIAARVLAVLFNSAVFSRQKQ